MAGKEKIQPYADNRIAYSSVLQASAANAKGWRTATFILGLITAISVGGAIYIGSQSKFIPVVIEIDGYGTPTRFYTVDEKTNTDDDRVTKAALAKVITATRGVSLDASYEKKVLDEVIRFFERSAPGFYKIQSYLTDEETNPFRRAKKELVDIQINNVIKITRETWQVEWKELIRERTGAVKNHLSFKATITVGKAEKISEAALYINPTGILIKELVWSQQINGKK